MGRSALSGWPGSPERTLHKRTDNGDVAPLASSTNDMDGPFVVVFDPSGHLWAANVDNSTLVELTRAQLATPGLVPAVTISAGDALENPYGMAFERRGGDLWVPTMVLDSVVECTEVRLAHHGTPRGIGCSAPSPLVGVNDPQAPDDLEPAAHCLGDVHVHSDVVLTGDHFSRTTGPLLYPGVV